MPVIGQYAPEILPPKLEDDVYHGIITKCNVVMDKDNPALAATNQWGKNQVSVTIQLDDERDDEGNPIELRRWINISYGQSKGTYAPLAQLIQAATGIKTGDKAQRNVTTEELTGKRLRVQTANVVSEKDGKPYCNLVGFFAPRKSGAIPPGQPTALVAPPQAAPKTAAARLGLDEDALDDLPEDTSLPF